MADLDARSLESASDSRAAWTIPVSSRPYPSLSSSPSLHPASKTCHVGDFPRQQLSEDLIHHRPSTRAQARHPGQGWTVIATISIAYLDFFFFSVSRTWECAFLTAQTAQTASGNVGVGGGDLFSLISKQSRVVARKPGLCSRADPGQPRTIVGSRSSGVPGRPGGSSQKFC